MLVWGKVVCWFMRQLYLSTQLHYFAIGIFDKTLHSRKTFIGGTAPAVLQGHLCEQLWKGGQGGRWW